MSGETPTYFVMGQFILADVGCGKNLFQSLDREMSVQNPDLFC